MGINQKTLALGSKRSIIREIFEYSKTRASEIGAENVFDFSLGNPSVPAPKEVNDTIKELLETESSLLLHGYTSAQGDANVRRVIANNLQVVDMTASILARDNKMPMWVFGLNEENSIVKALSGEFNGTKVTV